MGGPPIREYPERRAGQNGDDPSETRCSAPLHLARWTRYPTRMTQGLLFAVGALLLGAVVTLASLTDGPRFSWPLVLGILLLVDGVLRVLALRDEARAG